jgi:predicted  nucleic acid-binding Zn-ribbon protein
MLEQQVSTLTSHYSLAEDTINKLNQQLEELMHAKTEHENQLMSNFVQILNEKKLKIRNQQRLLAAATVDPAKGQ